VKTIKTSARTVGLWSWIRDTWNMVQNCGKYSKRYGFQ